MALTSGWGRREGGQDLGVKLGSPGFVTVSTQWSVGAGKPSHPRAAGLSGPDNVHLRVTWPPTGAHPTLVPSGGLPAPVLCCWRVCSGPAQHPRPVALILGVWCLERQTHVQPARSQSPSSRGRSASDICLAPRGNSRPLGFTSSAFILQQPWMHRKSSRPRRAAPGQSTGFPMLGPPVPASADIRPTARTSFPAVGTVPRPRVVYMDLCNDNSDS